MASAPTITPKKRHGMERPLIPGEIDSTPEDDYPDTGDHPQQSAWSVDNSRLVQCYAWNDPSISFSRSFQ
jgi:hypothetical protein